MMGMNYNIKDYSCIKYNLDTDITIIIFIIRSFNKILITFRYY